MSRYAAAAYGLCAVAVVVIGAVASALGVSASFFAATVIFLIIGVVTVAAAGRPQHWLSAAA
ncbi:hypothetical protein [Arthrobacter sp. 135MFCol5.1]|uniref:hypothetical protein n=1 Tax=Arthrobacter sp. 135MFCol5.1 TaxID=1158050 RepID=UPI00035C24F5|nr:hypothetical protein [Arthrobacter sp. 135MFCol5.1]